MRLAIRVQNSIREKYDLPKIEGRFEFQLIHKQYMLNEEEVEIPLAHKITNKRFIGAQNLIKIAKKTWATGGKVF